MGIIQKQSIKGVIYSYLGVILGFITTGYLMPKFMNQEEIGLLRVLVSYATLLAQFSSLGFTIVAIKVFPVFRDPETKNHGFFGLFSLIAFIGLLISLCGFYIYYQFSLKDESSLLLNQHIIYVIPLTVFTLLFLLTDSYYISLYDALKGSILKELIQRILIIIVIVFYIINLHNLNTLVFLYTLAFAGPPMIMLYSLIKSKTISLIPDFGFLSKEIKRNILNVSFFGLITSFSGIIVLNIDILMVERYLDLSAAGIYSISFFFGTLVLIPSRPLTRISGIVIAESFKNNDYKNIDTIYKKSSINLTIIALLLFLGLLINMENIILLIGEDYRPGYYVILLIALSNVIQMSSGTLNQILFYSNYYKYSTYFIIGYAVLLISSNIVFIPKYGLTGAAMATLISKSLYFLFRIVIVRIKLNLFPYQFKTLFPVFLTIILFYLQLFIDPFDNYIVDILVRSSLISLVFLLIIITFNISEDINLWIKSYYSKFVKSK